MHDRIIEISETSEPNSSTLLGPSDQKSKLTSGGRCAAEHQDQNGLFVAFCHFSPKQKQNKSRKVDENMSRGVVF